MQRRQHSARGDFENRAEVPICPAKARCPVKIPVAAFGQAGVGVGTVRALVLGAEVIESRQLALWSDSEDRATPVAAIVAVDASSSTNLRCPVEVSIAALDQLCYGIITVAAGEVVQRGQRATSGDFEDRAIIFGPAARRCPVKTPTGAFGQPGVGVGTVRPVEAVRGQSTIRSDFKNRATTNRMIPAPTGVAGPAIFRCSVEPPIGALDQSRNGDKTVRAIRLRAKTI